MKKIIRADYRDSLLDLKGQHITKVLTGVRRCGKSTILEMFRDELASANENVVYYNFEDLSNAQLASASVLYNEILGERADSQMTYVFLDEIQKVEGFESLIDSLFIHEDIDLYITGSNAFLLSSEFATYISGRYIEIEVLPFSFSEFVEAKDSQPSISLDYAYSHRQLFDEYLVNGSLPQTLAFKERSQTSVDQYLDAVIDSIVTKDVIFRTELKDRNTLRRVLAFLSSAVGSEVSPTNIANQLTSSGVQVTNHTVQKILDALEEAYIFYRASRYDLRGKTILKTQEKYYPVDTGIRNRILGVNGASDYGHLLESIVYFELKRRFREVNIGKMRNGEIDFVVDGENGLRQYIQVAYTVLGNEETLTRELRPLRALRDGYPKNLLTLDPLPWNIDGIQHQNVIQWLMQAM